MFKHVIIVCCSPTPIRQQNFKKEVMHTGTGATSTPTHDVVMHTRTGATSPPTHDGERQLSVAIPEYGAQPTSYSWKVDAQPKHNPEPSAVASIAGEEDVTQQAKNRLRNKRGLKKLSWFSGFRESKVEGKEANHSFFVREKEKFYQQGEDDISLVLSEGVHDKMYFKTCCGVALGDTYHHEVRYVMDILNSFFAFIGNPLICWSAAISAMFSEQNVPRWFAFVGAYFFIVVVPNLFSVLITRLYRVKTGFWEKDTREVLRYLIPAVLCCWVVSPIFGIYSIATFSLDAGADAMLFYAAYACCFLCLPCWPLGLVYFFGVYKIDDLFHSERIFIGILLCLDCGVLLGSAIHQAVMRELIWFPFVGAIGWCAIAPCVAYLSLFVGLESALPYFTTRNYLNQVVATGIALFGVLTLIFTALVAEKDLSKPTLILLDDRLLYGGAVVFYVAGIGAALLLSLYIKLET